jgi:hypothetical protein
MTLETVLDYSAVQQRINPRIVPDDIKSYVFLATVMAVSEWEIQCRLQFK